MKRSKTKTRRVIKDPMQRSLEDKLQEHNKTRKKFKLSKQLEVEAEEVNDLARIVQSGSRRKE